MSAPLILKPKPPKHERPFHHVIKDISFAADYLVCSCQKRMHVKQWDDHKKEVKDAQDPRLVRGNAPDGRFSWGVGSREPAPESDPRAQDRAVPSH